MTQSYLLAGIAAFFLSSLGYSVSLKVVLAGSGGFFSDGDISLTSLHFGVQVGAFVGVDSLGSTDVARFNIDLKFRSDGLSIV